MYHTIGRSIFLFLEAVLTFEQVNIVLPLYMTSRMLLYSFLKIKNFQNVIYTNNVLVICQGLMHKIHIQYQAGLIL